MKIGIIADDITGANDTGVQFSKIGIRTAVVWDLNKVKQASLGAEVIVVDTESRGDTAEQAYSKSLEAAKSLRDAGITLFYKKIDSTLRGNIGAELDGALDALSLSLAFVAPAYPKNRRITIGGHQLVGGLPVEYTEAAKDPISPVKTSYIPRLIQLQSRKRVGLIPLNVIAEGVKAVTDRILSERQKGNEIIVFDAAVDEHMRTISMVASSIGEPMLLCGSAGLAEEIPHAFNLIPRRKGVLVIAGSVSDVTAAQVDALEKTLRLKVIDVELENLLGDDRSWRIEVERAASEARVKLESGEDVAVRCSRRSCDVKRSDFNRRLSQQALLSALAEVAYSSINPNIAGLVLTGGDTAIAVIRRLQADSIQIIDEVEAGVPSGLLRGGAWDGLRIVTKAGAFGDNLTLIRAVEYLKRR